MKPSVLARIAAQLSEASAIVDAVESQQVRRPGSTQEYVPPRDPFEQSIAEIWAALLRVERVGRMDDFFRLGGHSLLATQMVSRVWERFRVEVPLVEIFTGPTLESFARAVRAAVTSAEAAEVATQTPPTRTVRPARLPLSYGQQRLWFLDQLDSGNASQNVALKWRLRGDLDTTALQSALNEIVARHEVLRTTFGMDGGEPVQVIALARPFVLPMTDLGTLPEAEREERARSLVNEETGRPFDLQRGPVFRAKLLKLSEKEHVLVFNIHHIATDGWSFGVFRKELATLYEAFMAGKPSPLPPLPQQYADYSVWQRTHVEGGPFQKQLEYWKEQLLNAPPSIELPTDHPRPAVQTYRGASRVAVLSSDLTKALKALSQQEGVTLFMTLLAAFNVLLSRYSGQEDIVVGTAIAGRTRGDTEKMIGLFLNTLALRTDLSGEPTFRELLGRVRETTINAYARQNVPFERLVEELNPVRDSSRSPLYQVMLVLQNVPSHQTSMPGLEITTFGSANETSQMDLLMTLVEDSQGLRATLTYNTDLFDAETVSRAMGHFAVLLEAVVEHPERRIGELPILTAEEERQVSLASTGPNVEYPRERCLHQFIEEQVERTPDASALVFASETLSYRELNARANQLAHRLRKLGVGPDVLVGICVERSLEMVVGLLGILKAGGAYVPLDPEYPRERLELMLADAEPHVLLTMEALVEALPEHGVQTICLDRDWDSIAGESTANPAAVTIGKHLAYVIYTSGSTGKPKGVPNVHEGIVNRLLWMQDAYGLEGSDRVLQKTPYSFDVSVWEFFWPLMTGACLVVAQPGGHKDPDYLIDVISSQQITTIHFVPSMLRIFLEADGVERCASLRRVICSGEALPLELQQRFFERLGAELHNLYGPTEASVDVTYWQCTPDSGRSTVPIGRPIWNTQIRILDRFLQPVPFGVPGELHIGGVGLARGYLKRPELTAEKFIHNPFDNGSDARLYKTGDLARMLPDGTVEYLGRIDHQVKIRGFRIELGEIEFALRQQPSVSDCVVIAREDKPGDKRLAAYVVCTEAFDAAEVRAALRQTLPDYMVPSAFVNLERLPLTPNGKVDRKKLPAPSTYGASEAGGHAPQTRMEVLLAEIWMDVLNVPSVVIEDDFFQLGGHSLLATQMVSRVREIAAVKLPLVEIFSNSTLEAFARVVQTAAYGDRGAAHAWPVRGTGPQRLPLSYGQQRLWFLDQLESGSSFYNVPLTLRLRGVLDAGTLALALTGLSARHEVLRTTYAIDGGEPVQVIAEAGPVELPVADLSGISGPERETQARVLASAEAARPFDLEHGPVFRAKLLKLSDEDHVLIVTTHHIAIDGWSVGVLRQELFKLYEAFLAGQASPLPPLRLQYADYALWQRAHFESEVLDRQLEYWKEQLRDAPGSIDLPTDRPRPAVQTYRGAKDVVVLRPELLASLKALGRKEGTTLFMTLLAAFNVLLSRYSGQEDVVVGSAIAGRTHSDTERLIGLFVNTLALRTDLSGEPTFRELLARVRKTTVEAYANQDVPFERLVEELNPVRDSSRSPLYQVMLILQNVPSRQTAMPGLEISNFGSATDTAQMDLLMSLAEDTQGLKATLTYNTDLYDASTIARMLSHFEIILRALIADPATADIRVNDIEMLSAAERSQVLEDWNRTAVDLGAFEPAYAAFLARAEREPERLALECGGTSWTNRDLATYACGLSQRLIAEGLEPGEVVGICVQRSAEMVGAMLAVMMAGGAYVPLDPRHPRERLRMALDDSGAAILLTMHGPGLETSAKALDISEKFTPLDASWQPAPLNAESLAYVIYTSGSTGKPKGVAIEHGALLNLLRSMQREPGLSADDTLVAVTTLAFDIAGLELLLPLLTGAKLVVATDDEVADGTMLLELIERSRATILQATPSAWRMLIDAGWTSALPLKALCGGEALPRELADKLLERSSELWNVYGPTETTIWSSATRVTRGSGPLRIGPPIANTQFYVLDRHRQPVPIGVPGELYIGGAGLARGYWNRPELTTEKFVADPFGHGRMYAAGDVARWRDDGTIELLGRADFQVKVRGFRIELGEIETALASAPGVRETVVVAREDTPGDKRLVAYVVSTEAFDAAEVRAALRHTLPDYMVPSAFVNLERLPLTPNGKVDRKKLPAPVIYSAGEVKGRAPESRMEVLLAEIWKDVLKVPSVNTDDDFFNLGGHSLLAAAMIAALNESLGYRVRLSSLFEASTLGALATAAEKQGRLEHQVSPIVPIKKTGTKPALFCVSRPNVNALGFIFLSRAVSKDLPVYGLQSNTETDGSISLFTLEEYEEKAREYIAAMREVQPDGPYFLTGFCEGGHIAFEMARQLEAMGLEVGILSVLDVWPIENTISRRRLKARNYGRVVLAFLKASNRDRLVMLERKLHGLPAIAPRPRVIAGKSIGTFGLNRDDRKLQSSYIASRHWPEKDFEPTIYNGKIIAFRVPKQPFYRIYDSYLGWRSRVRGTVEVIPTPGEHALILREPGVSVVAHELEARIDVYLARRAAATKLERSQSARGFSGDGAATADAF